MDTLLPFAPTRVPHAAFTPELLPSKLQILWESERGSIEDLTQVVLRFEQMLRRVEFAVEGMPWAMPALEQQIASIRTLIRQSRQRLLEPSPLEQLLHKAAR